MEKSGSVGSNLNGNQHPLHFGDLGPALSRDQEQAVHRPEDRPKLEGRRPEGADFGVGKNAIAGHDLRRPLHAGKRMNVDDATVQRPAEQCLERGKRHVHALGGTLVHDAVEDVGDVGASDLLDRLVEQALELVERYFLLTFL